ncbi:MAG: cysteine hydrolase [Phycisphaerae bacterium]|nr:cysteine hydrolase [Phycisphaerae bacterium]
MQSADRILLDIDTQRDFMEPDGALYVPEAETLIPNFVRLFDWARAAGIPIMSTADCHAKEDPEFDRFPPHCVAGTDGQAKLPETLLDRRIIVNPDDRTEAPERLLEDHEQVVFHKATLDVWSNRNAVRFVEAIGVGEYLAFGVATEYCVREEVLGLLRRGRRVVVVVDAIRAIAEEDGRAAIDEMTAAGARLTRTEEVIGGRR